MEVCYVFHPKQEENKKPASKKQKRKEERVLQKGQQVCACFHPKQEACLSGTKEWCSGRAVTT
jgi:hypothetical protein